MIRTHGSLFSGIGGFELACFWAGVQCKWACEKGEDERRVLSKRFPNLNIYKDVKEMRQGIPAVDLISGGFPCQPHSVAGQRKGKADKRNLWPEMLRVISSVRPRYFIGENVQGIISSGYADEVLGSAEDKGYATRAYILPAASVGAPHKRERVWFVGKLVDADSEGAESSSRFEREFIKALAGKLRRVHVKNALPNAEGLLFNGRDIESLKGDKPESQSGDSFGSTSARWEGWPVFDLSPFLRADDGVSDVVDRHKHRKRMSQLGNALIPAIAYILITSINKTEYDRYNSAK